MRMIPKLVGRLHTASGVSSRIWLPGRRLRTRVNYRDDSGQHTSLQERIPTADLEVLERADAAWQQLCLHGPKPPPTVAFSHAGKAPEGVAARQADVVVLGGTLGLLLATALLAQHQQQGQQQAPLRVVVVERGRLAGRQQEWNVTHSDLQVLVELGLLSAGQVEAAVATRCSAVRVGVAGQTQLLVRGVMDAGVSPAALLDSLKRRFTELGGQLLEGAAFTRLDAYADAAHVHLAVSSSAQATTAAAGAGAGETSGGAGGRAAQFATAGGDQQQQEAAGTVPLVLSAAVVVDALGSFSPLTAQARAGAAPEAAMLLVGSCVDAPAGAPVDDGGSTADLLWGMTPIDREACQQYWWERFPAAGGAATTAYMFAFTDPAPENARLLRHMLDRHCSLLPGYLGVAPESVSFRRTVTGFVPCWPERAAPVTDRLLPVGDSAGNRSALSLAGFCDLLRHLPRLTAGLLEALAAGATSQQELALLQPWSPGVAASVAMQRTMSVYSSQRPAILGTPPQPSPGAAPAAARGTAVLDIMAASFAAMAEALGPDGMRPFLQDRLTWAALAPGIGRQLKTGLPQLLAYSQFLGDTRGAPRLAAGLAGLGLYVLMAAASRTVTGPLHERLLAGSPRLLYRWHRAADAWAYGSGGDWQGAASGRTAAAPGPAPPPEQQQEQAGGAAVDPAQGEGEESAVHWEGADPLDQPLLAPIDPLHSIDYDGSELWRLTTPDPAGSSSGSSSSSTPGSVAAAAVRGNRLGARSSSSSSMGWGAGACRTQLLPRAASGAAAAAAAAGIRRGGAVAAAAADGRHEHVTGDAAHSIDTYDDPAGVNASSNGALLHSVDSTDVLDWPDAAGQGWAAASSSPCQSGEDPQAARAAADSPDSPGQAHQLPATTPLSSSSGGSNADEGAGVAGSAAQRSAGRCEPAAGGATHSVDTHDDDEALSSSDAATWGSFSNSAPLQSVDNTDVLDWPDAAGQGWGASGVSGMTAAAAAAASAGGVSSSSLLLSVGADGEPVLPRGPDSGMRVVRPQLLDWSQHQDWRDLPWQGWARSSRSSSSCSAGHATHSVDAYDDSAYDEDDDDGSGGPAMCSVDAADFVDWGSEPNNGWGQQGQQGRSSSSSGGTKAMAAAGSSRVGASGPGGGWGSSVRGTSLLPRRQPVAAVAVGRRARAVVATAAGTSPGSSSEPAPGQQQQQQQQASVDTYEQGLLPHYEGAEPLDQPLVPTLSDDPGHSVDNTELMEWGDNQGGGSADDKPADAAATAPAPAGPGEKQDAKRRKGQGPLRNIVDGKWQPPSREQSEWMMRQSMEMGPDEGV